MNLWGTTYGDWNQNANKKISVISIFDWNAINNINSPKFDIKNIWLWYTGRGFLFNYSLTCFHWQQVSMIRTTVNI